MKCDRGQPSCGWCQRNGATCEYKERRKPGLRAGYGRELEQRHTYLQEQGLEVSQKAEKLAMMMLQLSGMRQRMQGTLLELDQVLEGHG